MTDLLERSGNGGNGGQPLLTAAGDPAPVPGLPLILNDGYVELMGVNLRCLTAHLEVAPENKPVTITSMCAEVDYPGVTKWHLRLTFHQSFDPGAVYDTLESALTAYTTNGQACPFKVRPYASRVASAANPVISGFAIPQPFEIIMGDAGAGSQVQIDWNLNAPPSVDKGVVAATGAVAGSPGYYEPSGANIPADLAALTGLTATPAGAWSSGLYVITADLTANHYDGAAFAAGKAP